MAFSDSLHQEMEKQWEPCSQCIDRCHRNHKLAGIRKRRFCFFKVLMGNFEEQLRIPPAFLKHLEHEHSNKLVLEGPSGKPWHMTLERTTSSIVLQNGWEKFVKDHSLELGDFLVFRYNGDLNFTVQIFDRTACEKEDLLDIGYEEQKEVKEDPIQDFHVPQSESCNIKIQRNNVKGKLAPKVYSNKKRRAATEKLSSKVLASYFPSKGGDIHNPRNYQCGYFVSSRRPVTEEERARAYEVANSFKSSKPCFTLVMKPSQVYVGFYLHIPSEFAKNYCGPECKFIILIDPSGRRWRVHYLYKDTEKSFNGTNQKKKSAFSGGWKRFTVMNNLEEGDACVFELLDDCSFNVHIFRVVNEIQPLVHCKGKKTI